MPRGFSIALEVETLIAHASNFGKAKITKILQSTKQISQKNHEI
jgi:hypothetical protein